MQDYSIETLTHLFQSHYGLLIGIARCYAPAPDLVHDIMQEAFIDFVNDALKGNRDFDRDISPLLCTIVKNRAIKHWAERRKNTPEVLQEIAERLSRETEEAREEQLQDEIRHLKDCMGMLPFESRRLIEQHYRLGYSMEEIARFEQRKPDAIRQAVCRIRLRLRECIEKKLKKE